MALGLIPSWQFSPNPNVNPNITAYMQIPAGWRSQTHPQPLPPVAGPTVTLQQSSGFDCRTGLGCLPMAPTPAVLGISNPFDSFWWRHRQAIVIGGAAVAGLAVLAGLATLLR